MLVSITFNQLYLHFGKGKSILFEYAFKPIQTRGSVLPLLMLKAFSINKGNTDPLVWIGLNAYSKSIDFPLPKCKYNWLKVIDTSMSEISAPSTINEKFVSIKSRSSLLIISEVFGGENNLF